MKRRAGSDDLERLLGLVEHNRAQSPDGESGPASRLEPGTPVWNSNHEFWLEQLRNETSGSWSDQQYTDAANLINFAEHQRAALNDLGDVPVANDNTGFDTLTRNASAGDGAGTSDQSRDLTLASSDQIAVRDAFWAPAANSKDSPDMSPLVLETGTAGTPPDASARGLPDERDGLAAITALKSRESASGGHRPVHAGQR